MARGPDSYSRTISWLKVALPMVGLAILSMLFLVARGTRVEQTNIPPELRAPDGGIETVTAPDYTAVTADGASVSITAETAWPSADGSGEMLASGVSVRFDRPDGEQATVTSDDGTLLPDEDIIELRGNVVVTTASGWTMRSEALDATLDWTRVTSPTEVRTEGPLGTLDADRMLITRDIDAEDSYLMEFEGNVHMVYRPEQEGP